MDVCSADAKGADTSAAREAASLPVREPDINVEGTILEVQLRIGMVEVETRWKLLCCQSFDYFDETGDSGCRIQVADIRLDRTNGAVAFSVRTGSKRFSEGGDFDRIT